MAPDVDCGEGCVVQQKKHGQVVVGFVNDAQMHIYDVWLDGFPVKGFDHGGNTFKVSASTANCGRVFQPQSATGRK